MTSKQFCEAHVINDTIKIPSDGHVRIEYILRSSVTARTAQVDVETCSKSHRFQKTTSFSKSSVTSDDGLRLSLVSSCRIRHATFRATAAFWLFCNVSRTFALR